MDRAGHAIGGLNREQEEAARHVGGPLLILAGAGSGKTRVLVHRIAYLVREAGVPPWAILAITFTNKAAREMKSRVERMLADDSAAIWISTFHAACVRMLRRDIERLGYQRAFTVCDADDQLSLLRKCIKELNISDKLIAPRAALEEISRAKDAMQSPEEYGADVGSDFRRTKIARIFKLYQTKLRQNNALDFDDIILLTVKLLREHADVRDYYQTRFRHVLVDEYQDTNKAQYALVMLLSGKWRNLCVVGDDDQSIYGWRGANIGNILGFEKDFPDARVIKLEQNYRSTVSILDAANAVIKENANRKHKRLWTENDGGGRVVLMTVASEYDEASYVAYEIQRLKLECGLGWNSFAVLYRVNAQSRALENTLIREGVPYRVVGGFKFFDRKEVKDIIAYLRLIQNPHDDLSFLRVINVPKRGIGVATVEKLAAAALAMGDGVSLFEAASALCAGGGEGRGADSGAGDGAAGSGEGRGAGSGADDGAAGSGDAGSSYAGSSDAVSVAAGSSDAVSVAAGIKGAAHRQIAGFVSLVSGLARESGSMGMESLLDLLLERSGILKSYKADKSEESLARLENILELKTEIIEFGRNYQADAAYFADAEAGGYGGAPQAAPDAGVGGAPQSAAGAGAGGGAHAAPARVGLSEFLMHVTLMSDIDNLEEEDEKVSLMTMHSAKGLEFDAVFVVGAEEGIFPGVRAMADAKQLEEERRLCYVAITRAKKHLCFTRAATRTLFGSTACNRLSRFVSDIPEGLLEHADGLQPSWGGAGAGVGVGGDGGGSGAEHGSAPVEERHRRYSSGAPPAPIAPRGRPAAYRPPGMPSIAGRAPGPLNAFRGAMHPEPQPHQAGLVFAVGDAVRHKKYGAGKVSKRLKDGSDYVIEVEFEGAGMRRFIEAMVSLQRVE